VIGSTIGAYRVVAKLGAGGMGEVYRAHDRRLSRDVALKILPATFAADADRLARFDREAKALAALNHPGIAHVYDAGHQGGVAYLVMELVEGEDLSAVIARGAVPLGAALPIARQVAEAIQVAHEHGIIHRDLKPANIKLRDDGTVKVLDFGLAKIFRPETAGAWDSMTSPTLTARATHAGVILGTAAYMAPEQAKGQPADRRADVWAFGVVFYEMLTGRRAFGGDDVSETLAAVLKDTPTADALPADAPASVRRLLRRCLEKDRAKRLDSMTAVRLEIDEALAGDSEMAAIAPVAPSRTGRPSAMMLGAALVTGALAATATWFLKPAPAVSRVVTRFSYALPEGQVLTRPGRRSVAIAPDGTMVAYIANRQIYLRHMHELEAKPLRGTDVDPVDVVFSPDGRSIAYFSGTGAVGGPLSNLALNRIDVTGGTPVVLCHLDSSSYGVRWMGDRIVFSDGRRILVVPDTGGTPEPLVAIDPKSVDRLAQPQLLADGRAVIYTFAPGGAFVNSRIVAQVIPDGEPKTLVADGMDGRVLPSGHLVWLNAGTLFAQGFHARTLTLTGVPVPIVEGVSGAGLSGAGHYHISETGTLVFVPGLSGPNDLVWVDRTGTKEPTGAPSQSYTYPRVSPDGTRIVANATDGDGDVWIWDVPRRTLSKLTAGPELESYPVWTPDSRFVLFRSGSTGGQIDLYRRAADGTGAVERLTESPEAESPQMVLPDGRLLLRRARNDVASLGTIDLIDPKPGAKAVPVFATPPAGMTSAEVSPDGRWIAYDSPEGSTQTEVHVRPFPDVNARRFQISSGGGGKPMWSRSSREAELFYVVPGPPPRLMHVPVRPSRDNEFTYGSPKTMFALTGFETGLIGRAFDIHPDGRRFLMVAQAGGQDEARRSLTVVTHWLDELRARVPTAR
jgi:serine/threonine-protein kinase